MNLGETLTHAVKILVRALNLVVDFRGHIGPHSNLEGPFVDFEEAIILQDENMEKVRSRPKTKKQVRALLGLVGYGKEFIPNYEFPYLYLIWCLKSKRTR
ncbi:hypothetical protein PoB_005440300 [Plakobranchus ocellatus]|uniref:Uncharacterized protein n=1 Tax=Plakobranchus ocellatus TaxID=259542 RepID=A0AAV4CA97_9GAST|nr:hypothetical protein PoB_005440300 [Plakobranchus ocellatus]